MSGEELVGKSLNFLLPKSVDQMAFMNVGEWLRAGRHTDSGGRVGEEVGDQGDKVCAQGVGHSRA